jgi:hypothetical protein
MGAKMFTFVITADQLQVIDRALAEMPFRLAAPVLNALNEQLSRQRPALQAVENNPDPVPAVA